MKLLEVKRLMVVVAHCDDESLFCGGTLLRLRDAGCQLHIIVATHVNDTNHGSSDEAGRQRMRLNSFDHVISDLGSTMSQMELPNYRGFPGTLMGVLSPLIESLADEIATYQPEAILTHNHDGEYGNWMHRIVHYAVRDVWPGPAWAFSLTGQEHIAINWEHKRRLLNHYRESVVLGQVWEPWSQGAFRPWCQSTESFCRMHQ